MPQPFGFCRALHERSYLDSAADKRRRDKSSERAGRTDYENVLTVVTHLFLLACGLRHVIVSPIML
jgi:hypothetical protein